MEDVGGNLGGIIGDLMSKGWQPRVVYDNFDSRITPGQLTKDHQNTDNHWISQFITFDRIDSSGFDNSKPIGDLYSPRNDPDPEIIPNPEMIPKSTPK